MIIERMLTTTINISPSEAFELNQDKVCLAKLRGILQGRCKYSMMFLEILRIEKRTANMLPRDRSDGTCDVDVTFWARCICVSDGEIIQNCDVQIKNEHIMYAKHEIYDINLIGDITLFREIIGKNIKLPLMVHEKPAYPVGRSKICVIGKFYLPRPKEQRTKIFMYDRGLSAEEEEKVKEVLRQLHEEMQLHQPLAETQRYTFFENVLKNVDEKDWSEEKWPLKKRLSLESVSLDAKELADLKVGAITFPAGDARKKLRFFHTAGNKEKLLMQVADEDMETCSWISADLCTIILLRINQCLVYLQNLRGFVTTFDTQDKVAALFNYWTLCLSINSK